MPTWRLRLSDPVHVSTRSPSPLRPAVVSRRAAGGARQPRDLGQAARDERGERVVPEAQPFDHAGGDRDDVLQRAADLDADDVGRSVQAEVRPAELGLDELGAPRNRADATRTAVGSCCATSVAKLGPDSTTTGPSVPSSAAITSDIRSSVSASSPLVALTIVARGVEIGRRGAHHRAAAVRRHRRHHQLAAVERSRRAIDRHRDASGSRTSGR